MIASLDRGNATAAINLLAAFINEVEALVQAGLLTATDGQLLTDVAQNVIDQLLSESG